MEDLIFKSINTEIGSKPTRWNRDSKKRNYQEGDEIVKSNYWDKFFTKPLSKEDVKKSLEAERLKLQLLFPFIGQVKTYLKSQILSAKKAIKKLFKKAKIKVQSVVSITQMSFDFAI